LMRCGSSRERKTEGSDARNKGKFECTYEYADKTAIECRSGMAVAFAEVDSEIKRSMARPRRGDSHTAEAIHPEPVFQANRKRVFI